MSQLNLDRFSDSMHMVINTGTALSIYNIRCTLWSRELLHNAHDWTPLILLNPFLTIDIHSAHLFVTQRALRGAQGPPFQPVFE
jgi:hypothetical protein